MTMPSLQRQLDLFEHVAAAYAQPANGRLTNDEMYRIAAGRAGISKEQLDAKTPIGVAGTERSTVKRALRWRQQSLAKMQIIQRVAGQRGVWELTEGGRQKLRKVQSGVTVLGFSTKLGMAILGNCQDVFRDFDEPVMAVITSPPFPLSRPRAYGNPHISEYSDFICATLEPLVRNLVKGGNVLLQLGDVYLAGSPAKSTYIEELIVDLKKRLGLHFMNRIVWRSNKAPSPIAWASKRRIQCHEAAEYCIWFSNDPINCISNNQRVLEPHTEQHKKLIARGGEQRTAVNGDGAYRIKPGAYGRPTEGRIMRNVLDIPNVCASQRAYKRRVTELGLKPHGASMPLALARKLVRFLSDAGQLVVEPFFGSGTTALACELEKRAWVGCDNVFDYVRGAAERFVDFEDFELALESL